jgi:hypothetical protein
LPLLQEGARDIMVKIVEDYFPNYIKNCKLIEATLDNIDNISCGIETLGELSLESPF